MQHSIVLGWVQAWRDVSALAVKIINKIKYDQIKQNYIKLRHLWSKNKDEDKMNENLKKKKKMKMYDKKQFSSFSRNN